MSTTILVWRAGVRPVRLRPLGSARVGSASLRWTAMGLRVCGGMWAGA